MTLDTHALIPPPGERVFLAGQTGSGKTVLARVLLSSRRHVVVLDAKGLLKWPGYTVYKTLDALTKAPRAQEKLIYRPSWQDLSDPDEMEKFFQWCYLRRHCTVYVDELYSVTRGDQFPPHLGACLTRGRELGVEFWCATQRPKNVPQVTMSEAEHGYIFKLKLPQDRQRVEDILGITSETIAALPKHYFVYARQEDDPIGPLTLDAAHMK